jgi:hypothetical protein
MGGLGIGHDCSIGVSVCKVLISATSGDLQLPAGKGGQQRGAYLWHAFLSNGDTSDNLEMCQWGLYGMEISILGSEKTLNNAEYLL